MGDVISQSVLYGIQVDESRRDMWQLTHTVRTNHQLTCVPSILQHGIRIGRPVIGIVDSSWERHVPLCFPSAFGELVSFFCFIKIVYVGGIRYLHLT